MCKYKNAICVYTLLLGYLVTVHYFHTVGFASQHTHIRIVLFLENFQTCDSTSETLRNLLEASNHCSNERFYAKNKY